ncbi:MAG: 4Fe-4S binding protein [Candidatus Heimdallarchaeota archaeon]|nr:4Fe-4S binding protein [Candidatus Heimdallarchaeota archaeon]
MTVKKEISFIPPDYRQQEKWQLRIITDRCKGCLFCIEYCPSQILESSSEINTKGYHPPKLKEGLTMDDCAKCGFCELICPEFSIYLEKQTTPVEKPYNKD